MITPASRYDMRLSEKVALVTGGTRGMGLAIGRLFAQHGARVILGCRNTRHGEEVVASLKADGLNVSCTCLDVTHADDWRIAVAKLEQAHGRLDVLVNNAGLSAPSGLLDCRLDEWNEIIAVNQTGVFLGMKYAAPAMLRAGKGSIINISSVLGTIGTEFGIAYHASKGAVHLLTRAAAVTLAPKIRVNSVTPGITATDMAASMGERLQQRVAAYPMGRAGHPDEIAQCVLFLASDESSFATGADYRVDGGALAGLRRSTTL
jgi:cyclopentanol dehydrogenase